MAAPSPSRVTKAMLEGHRRARDRPASTFDLDGDGVVSQRDFYLSSNFDLDKDRHLNPSELAAARSTLGHSGMGQLQFNTPPVPSVAARTPGRTRTDLMRERKMASCDENQRVMTAYETRTRKAHKFFKKTLPNAHPWATPSGSSWGPDVELDKISSKLISTQRPQSTPTAFSASRDLESVRYGTAQKPDLDDWNTRRKLHRVPKPDKHTDVLAKANYKPTQPTFGGTYTNIISGSSQKDRGQEVHGYFSGVRKNRGQMKADAARVNDDREGGLTCTATGVHQYDPWFSYGNPTGKTLVDDTKRKVVGGVGGLGAGRPVQLATGAGLQSGENADKRGRLNVTAAAKYTNGNVTVYPVIAQSKFTYNEFQRE